MKFADGEVVVLRGDLTREEKGKDPGYYRLMDEWIGIPLVVQKHSKVDQSFIYMCDEFGHKLRHAWNESWFDPYREEEPDLAISLSDLFTA